MDDCDPHQPAIEDNALVLTLSAAMCGFVEHQSTRASRFREVLRMHGIDTSPTTIDNTEFTTDGDMQFSGFRYLIIEVVNEIGPIGAEPYQKAMSKYMHSTKTFASEQPGFRFPCMLITIFGKFLRIVPLLLMTTTFTGAHISFSAAVWGTRPNMQVLSTALPLFWHHTDTKMRTMAACHFGALRKALSSLRQCYQDMTSSIMGPVSGLDFPYSCSYTCINTLSERQFVYIKQIDESRRIFFAKTIDDETVCIKFAYQYSKDAHEFCASMGFAPALRGFEQLASGWYMVVMENIGDDWRTLYSLSAPYTHFEDIRCKLGCLHEAGYVHGDFRDTNILVKEDGSEGFKLIDFEWSGKAGSIRYPNSVNRKDFWRPAGAEDGQLIRPEHDMEMLETLQRNNK